MPVSRLLSLLFCLPLVSLTQTATADSSANTAAIVKLLQSAQALGHAHGARYAPVLSPLDTMIGSTARPAVFDFKAVQQAGFPVVAWTVNDSARLDALLALEVDGIISDRPDLLHQAVEKARSNETDPARKRYLARFDAQAHRGGRDLRPENTLPSFESGLDNLVNTLETDTGVTTDGISLISHEQFINPQTCRASDGSRYDESNRIWIKDITFADAQRRFICDKLFRGPQQKNDRSLSPVAVAFTQEKKLADPYVPTCASQLFEFVSFYVAYYRDGAGKSLPEAPARWQNAAKVRFNLETKVSPQSTELNQTRSPRDFVDALASAIEQAHLTERADVQSFDFRTLDLLTVSHPNIRTVYLIESMRWTKAPRALPQ